MARATACRTTKLDSGASRPIRASDVPAIGRAISDSSRQAWRTWSFRSWPLYCLIFSAMVTKSASCATQASAEQASMRLCSFSFGSSM